MVNIDAHLFEFVVPMVPPCWNNPARVSTYAADLARSANLTALAVSTLDVCQPAVDTGTDYFTHWGLTHFLLDGHHKMQAAAENGTPLQLLSLLSLEASLASPEQIVQIPALRGAPRADRRPQLIRSPNDTEM